MVDGSVRARIAALAEAEPALADDLRLRGALIEIVDHAAVSLPELRLPADLVRARLAAGTPLLDQLDLPMPRHNILQKFCCLPRSLLKLC